MSKNGSDTAKCGTILYPCATLYWASTKINQTYAYQEDLSHIIHVIDGQNIPQIMQYKQVNETNGWNPCLPIPISGSTAITFDRDNIQSWRDWYPLNICDYKNNTAEYKNEYLFQGGVSLTINNLYIFDYIIDNDTNYPILGSGAEFNASITINNGMFINIFSSISSSLFYSWSSIYVESTNFINIAISNIMFYGFHSSLGDTRSFLFENNHFNNISADRIFDALAHANDVK